MPFFSVSTLLCVGVRGDVFLMMCGTTWEKAGCVFVCMGEEERERRRGEIVEDSCLSDWSWIFHGMLLHFLTQLYLFLSRNGRWSKVSSPLKGGCAFTCTLVASEWFSSPRQKAGRTMSRGSNAMRASPKRQAPPEVNKEEQTQGQNPYSHNRWCLVVVDLKTNLKYRN